MILAMLLLAFFRGTTSAQKLDIYQVTIVGNDQPGTTPCSLLGEAIGPIVMDTLQVLVPGLTDYPSPSGRRGLRVAKSKVHRDLSVNLCSRSYCQKPRNYQACYYNGCSCACGKRRLILSGLTSSVSLSVVRTALNNVVASAAATITGCTLGLVLKRASLDQSLL